MKRQSHTIARLLGTCLLCLGPLAAQAATTLKISTIVPAGTHFVRELRSAGETIAERTDGRIEFKLFPGGVMGSDQAVLRKMRIGQLHGAAVTAVGVQNIAPDAQVYSLPFVFRDYGEVEYVRERIDSVIRERLAGAGFVLAGMSEGGFTYLFSKKPIRRLEDLAEVRLWSPEGDTVTRRMLERGGAKVVSLPVADVYTSLQTGLIDTVTITTSGAIALQWHTGIDYQVDAPLLLLMGMLVFDRRALEPLNPGDREILLEVLDRTFERLDRINREADREAQQALRDLGIELLQPTRPPAERRWRTIAHDTLRDLAAEGRFDPELFERVQALVAEYRERADTQ